jgi:hypothetical protein
VLTDAAGLAGAITNSGDRWTSNTPHLVVPPGTLTSVCVFVQALGQPTVWFWARATDLTVAPANGSSGDFRTYVSGTHFTLDVDNAQQATSAANACPAL